MTSYTHPCTGDIFREGDMVCYRGQRYRLAYLSPTFGANLVDERDTTTYVVAADFPGLRKPEPAPKTYTNAHGTFRVGDKVRYNGVATHYTIACIRDSRVWLTKPDGTDYIGINADRSTGNPGALRPVASPCAEENKKIEELSKQLAEMKQSLEQEKALRFAATPWAYGSGGSAGSISNLSLADALSALYFKPPTPVPMDKGGIEVQVGDFVRRPGWKHSTGGGWHEVVEFGPYPHVNDSKPGVRLKQRGVVDSDSWYLAADLPLHFETEDRTFTNAKGQVLRDGDKVKWSGNPGPIYTIFRIRANGRVWVKSNIGNGYVYGGGSQDSFKDAVNLSLYVPMVTVTRTVTYTGTPEQMARLKAAKADMKERYGLRVLAFTEGDVAKAQSGILMTVTSQFETTT